MAKKSKTDVSEEKANRELPKSRRYVGSKETTAYILYDIAKSLNISTHDTYFVTDILVVALRWQTIINAVASAWDIINDLFLTTLVDRTNTRFGKFKPYLVIYAGPALAFGVFYWALPLIFPGTSATYMPKLITLLLFKLISDIGNTCYGVAQTGIMATITPDAVDRSRLINMTNLISSLVENLPQQATTIFIDLVNRNIMKISMANLFVIMGIATAALGGLISMYFAFVCKERVLQATEKPDYKAAFTSLFRSRPLMVLAINDMISAFAGLGTSLQLYYINVLNFSSAKLVVGIPGMFVTYIGYSYVTKLREIFSTKTLWIVGDHIGGVLYIFVYMFGSVNKNFKKLWPMIFAFMARETLINTTYAMNKTVNAEILNEVMDYGEWKNGYRTEGAASLVRSLASKVTGSLGNVVTTMLLEATGYRQGLKPGQQSERTEYLMFLTCTLVPGLTSLIGLIPKFFYNIDNKTKKRMYEELAIRRSKTAKELNAQADSAVVEN